MHSSQSHLFNTSIGYIAINGVTEYSRLSLIDVNITLTLNDFQVVGATIMDHHAASESFMKFMENEMKQRGGCPADWVWVVPPLSSSITPVFHQEMLLYKLKPSYEYQVIS